MKKYSIVGMCQIYNELRKENLERFIKYIMPLVDALVVFDDGSTDGSYDYLLHHTPHVIRGLRNNFANERSHKQVLLQETLKLKPDFILWLDADEVLTANSADQLQGLCAYCVENQIDGLSFHELNLWRSHSWRRVDSLYDTGWFVRLWRVTPDMHYEDAKPGLHQAQYPSTVRNIVQVRGVEVLHYGFSSERRLAYKYLVYKSHGQRGYDMLDRLISEEKLVVQKVPKELFPEGLWIDDEAPKALAFEESLAYVEKYREEVFRPKFSVICLVYKSIEWLKFVYEQVFKYTDMTDKEFFFVANDATPEVLAYLKNNYIPHFVYENTPVQRKEWFINNVYRAYNYAATKARGDILIFINSDMAFTPNWLDNLWKHYIGSNCVTSRLVESGKLRSGQYGIERDFGRNYSMYREKDFLEYVPSISYSGVVDGGLFMPLLICKEHFMSIGGYPQGNIIPESNLFTPVIAKGEPCISGDNVLMRKLASRGIIHQTAFDSIVYHFQCGELDSSTTQVDPDNGIKVAVCNDLVTGSMGERVFWDYLLENLPASIGIDQRVLGNQGDYAENAQRYIREHYPEVKVIIQNATFINSVDPSRYTIAFLQDNLRSMGRPTLQQEQNLKIARRRVTSSLCNADSYREYDFDLIPIGLDSELFKPLDKAAVRAEFGYGSGQIGIFVGDFTEVKGWAKVYDTILHYPDIQWILVSKGYDSVSLSNVQVYNRIPQTLLVKLLNCADFFILGSPVETQCLAALEACLCNIPVVMRNVGIFRSFSVNERSQCGIFGEDFINAIHELPKRVFTPRARILELKLTIQDTMEVWKALVTKAFQEIRAQNGTTVE